MSYLTYVKTLLVNAVTGTFDDSYPVEQFRNVHASIEFPVDKQAYPGVWIDYEDTDSLKIAGVGHVEYVDPSTGDTVGPFTRWEYTGAASFTVVALTSLERDRLYDELVNVVAFGPQDPILGRFRSSVVFNPYITANINYDEIGAGGKAEAQGTPWGTDEIVYERTFTLDMIGEFVPSANTGALLLLSKVIVDIPDPTMPSNAPLNGAPDGGGGWY